jgi:hypothetical protein
MPCDGKSVYSCNHITIHDEECLEEEDAEYTLAELNEGVKAIIDKLKEVNLGTIEDPFLIYISALLSPEEEEAYINLLKEFRDVFVSSYKEIPSLYVRIVVHHLAVRDGVAPVCRIENHTSTAENKN